MLRGLRLSVAFQDTLALDAVNLTVRDGEVLAVMGPSGCGKTTLLRAIAGLQTLDIGTISWDGRDLRDVPPHDRGFGFMFQDYALFPHLTVRGNVEFGLRMHGVDGSRRTERLDNVLEMVGLADYAERHIHELSGGEQQRVALARTLAPSPRLILLDEPVGALDRSLRAHLIAEMHAIFQDLEVTAIYVTHDRDEAFAIADTVAVMNNGRLVRRAKPQELWADPRSEFVATMLGFSAMVDAQVYDGWADVGWAKIASRLSPGEHRLTIPPDAIRIAADGPAKGKVLRSTYRGGTYNVEFVVGGSVLQAATTRRFAAKDEISFHIDASGVLTIDQ